MFVVDELLFAGAPLCSRRYHGSEGALVVLGPELSVPYVAAVYHFSGQRRMRHVPFRLLAAIIFAYPGPQAFVISVKTWRTERQEVRKTESLHDCFVNSDKVTPKDDMTVYHREDRP